jgi:hypothetical protein
MKFVMGITLGIVLSFGAFTLVGQPERQWHPRIARALDALRDARAYLQEAPHDFGGHKAAALHATDEAIRQLDFALHYRAREDRR